MLEHDFESARNATLLEEYRISGPLYVSQRLRCANMLSQNDGEAGLTSVTLGFVIQRILFLPWYIFYEMVATASSTRIWSTLQGNGIQRPTMLRTSLVRNQETERS